MILQTNLKSINGSWAYENVFGESFSEFLPEITSGEPKLSKYCSLKCT
jgi:hypothetical protein